MTRIPLTDEDINLLNLSHGNIHYLTITLYEKGRSFRELKKQILDDYEYREYYNEKYVEELKEKADLHDQLIKILIQHCGEDGDNEGAVKTLNRIIEKAEKWDKIFHGQSVMSKALQQMFEDNVKLEQENKQIKDRNESMNAELLWRDEIIQQLRDTAEMDCYNKKDEIECLFSKQILKGKP